MTDFLQIRKTAALHSDESIFITPVYGYNPVCESKMESIHGFDYVTYGSLSSDDFLFCTKEVKVDLPRISDTMMYMELITHFRITDIKSDGRGWIFKILHPTTSDVLSMGIVREGSYEFTDASSKLFKENALGEINRSLDFSGGVLFDLNISRVGRFVMATAEIHRAIVTVLEAKRKEEIKPTKPYKKPRFQRHSNH